MDYKSIFQEENNEDTILFEPMKPVMSTYQLGHFVRSGNEKYNNRIGREPTSQI